MGQTLLLSSWPWNLFEQHVFPLFFLPAVFEHKLNFDWASLTSATLSLTLLKVIFAPLLFSVVYAAVGVSDRHGKVAIFE